MNWSVYIILASDTSYYTGITTDIERRYQQHATGKGAKFFYGRKPVEIVYQDVGHDRSSASREEARIKSLSRAEKKLLISSCVKPC